MRAHTLTVIMLTVIMKH